MEALFPLSLSIPPTKDEKGGRGIQEFSFFSLWHPDCLLLPPFKSDGADETGTLSNQSFLNWEELAFEKWKYFLFVYTVPLASSQPTLDAYLLPFLFPVLQNGSLLFFRFLLFPFLSWSSKGNQTFLCLTSTGM